MEIKYVKGDLFVVASKGSYKAHACNCQGIWGGGIAAAFARLYPKSYKEYADYCKRNHALGTTLITSENVVCLHTSDCYGYSKDSVKEILAATDQALRALLPQLPNDATVYSNRFNSGLFGVAWDKTERVLTDVLVLRPDVQWIVCDV